jgi:hypothetical protein
MKAKLTILLLVLLGIGVALTTRAQNSGAVPQEPSWGVPPAYQRNGMAASGDKGRFQLVVGPNSDNYLVDTTTGSIWHEEVIHDAKGKVMSQPFFMSEEVTNNPATVWGAIKLESAEPPSDSSR